MKKIKFLVCSALIAGFGMTSCSSDDDKNTNNDTVQIQGTYNLTEVNTAQDTDFNEDGELSSNQMDETDCFDNGRMIFNSDNTFTYDMRSIIVNEEEGTSACSGSNEVNGTWELVSGSGSNAVISAVYENNNGDNVTLNITKQGNEIWYTGTGYADRNEEGGATYNSSGNVEYVFTRQ